MRTEFLNGWATRDDGLLGLAVAVAGKEEEEEEEELRIRARIRTPKLRA